MPLDLADEMDVVLSWGAVDESRYVGTLTKVDATACKNSQCFEHVQSYVNGHLVKRTQPQIAIGKSPLYSTLILQLLTLY